MIEDSVRVFFTDFRINNVQRSDPCFISFYSMYSKVETKASCIIFLYILLILNVSLLILNLMNFENFFNASKRLFFDLYLFWCLSNCISATKMKPRT